MNSTARNALLALIITATVFGTGFWTSNAINDLRIKEVRAIQDNIATDILSLETQFELLGQLSCTNIKENSVLSSELNDLAERLNYTENQLGSDNEEVVSLKKQYSLLQIKDYLLMQQVAEKCDLEPVFVLYFYSNEGDCESCKTAGNVLTYLRDTYKELRVYSFDYHLDLGALETLIAVNKIKSDLPVLIIDGKPHYGLSSLESIQAVLPLEKLATTTVTTD